MTVSNRPTDDGAERMTESEAKREAYDMAYDRCRPMDAYIGSMWDDMSEEEQRREMAEGLSHWKEGAHFCNTLAPKLRGMAEELADAHEENGSEDLTLLSWFETLVFEAFDHGAYDAYEGNERYEMLEVSEE